MGMLTKMGKPIHSSSMGMVTVTVLHRGVATSDA